MTVARAELDRERRQLEKVLESHGFVRNERMSRFLRFLAERHWQGRDQELKESVIAVEVFGRKPDHDPAQDSIVRTEAGRLRARLAEYYLGEGKGDAIVIELPKGGYTPAFLAREEKTVPAKSGLHQLWWIAIAAVLCGTVGFAAWRMASKSAPVVIAVLPLENLSHNPTSDYFADGLTDELIRNLSLIDGLAPRSRTSSFAFKGKPRNVRVMGKELGADYVLEGSVLSIGQHLRVDADLVRVRDDLTLWSGRYDRTLTDVFAIQDEISRGIVNSLRLKLGRGQRRYETSPEAYDLYLQARAAGIQEGLDGELRSVARFEAAIAKDPEFAPAYAGLAAALVARSGAGQSDSPDELKKMEELARKALDLDPLLAEAHGALGMVYARQAQWEQSEKSFRRALELDPNDSLIYGNYALDLLFPLDRIDEAVKQLREAVKRDPLARRPRFILANALIAAERFDEAVDVCRRLPDDFPGKNVWLGRALLGQGRVTEAIGALEDARIRAQGSGDVPRGFLAYAYARAGRREDAEKLAGSAEDPFVEALAFAGMGDKDRTLASLEKMAGLGPVRLGRNLTYPEFRLVRGDPRLRDLRKKVGLPN